MSVVLISSDSDTEVTSTIRSCRKDNFSKRCVDCLVGRGECLMSELRRMIDADSGSSSASVGMSDDSEEEDAEV